MRFGARVGSLVCILVLAACGDGGGSAPVFQNVDYILPSTPGGRVCVNQCNESREYCKQSCDLDYRACYNSVQISAQSQYDQYARERFSEHLPIAMLPSDFEHPEPCAVNKKTCYADCGKPYNKCYRSCGGTVNITTSCQYLCFE